MSQLLAILNVNRRIERLMKAIALLLVFQKQKASKFLD